MATPKRVTVTKDNVSKVFAGLRELLGQQVLIGIPDDNANRQDDDAANNALIGYTMEFGSPAQNIPARAFLIPGVEKARDPALYQLKMAATAALDGDAKKIAQKMNAAGVVGSNSVRNEITTGNFAPLAPSTVAGRHRQRSTQSMRESEQVYLMLISKGVEPGAAQAETGIRPLINTGQLRNSITYVVRKL